MSRTEYMRRYYRDHRTQCQANQLKYDMAHREERRARARTYYQSHRQEKLAYARAYRAKNIETLRVKDRGRVTVLGQRLDISGLPPEARELAVLLKRTRQVIRGNRGTP